VPFPPSTSGKRTSSSPVDLPLMSLTEIFMAR
jgi:hypothetical protein